MWALTTIPAITLVSYYFSLSLLTSSVILLPAGYNLYDMAKLKLIVFRSEVHKLWLLKNGDQVLVQTFDKMLHRLNIIDNKEHEIVENTDHLVFVMNNSGREYLIANKNSVILDYDLIDRVIKGIRVDTTKFQKLYNRLIFRQ